MMEVKAGIKVEQDQRYKRNIQLAGIGTEGQEKLFRASVLLVGAGGLGSPAAFILPLPGSAGSDWLTTTRFPCPTFSAKSCTLHRIWDDRKLFLLEKS